MIKKCAILCLLGLFSCITKKNDENQSADLSAPSFYTLKEGDIIQHKAPLPNLTKIYVDWTYSDGGKASSEGFRGWDIDRDGKFDVLEALDSSGKVYIWAFDFDGDGIIDAVNRGETNGSQVPGLRPAEGAIKAAHH